MMISLVKYFLWILHSYTLNDIDSAAGIIIPLYRAISFSIFKKIGLSGNARVSFDINACK